MDRVHPTALVSGSRIVPTMMIAGMASRKQPTTRNGESDEEAGADAAHLPGGDALEDGFGIW
jgi:hypothetical protein